MWAPSLSEARKSKASNPTRNPNARASAGVLQACLDPGRSQLRFKSPKGEGEEIGLIDGVTWSFYKSQAEAFETVHATKRPKLKSETRTSWSKSGMPELHNGQSTCAAVCLHLQRTVPKKQCTYRGGLLVVDGTSVDNPMPRQWSRCRYLW